VRAPKRSLRRRLGRLSRAQFALSILALVVVFSLVVTAVGSAVVDGLSSSGSNDDSNVDANDTTDEYGASLRDDATKHPDDPETLAALANYLAMTGQLTEAIGLYEKALALKPDDWDLRLDFARSLSDGGKRNDAELQFKKVIGAQPTNAQAHYFLAELYRNWVPARNDDAAAEYRRTIEVGPDTYVAEESAQALQELGFATPAPLGTPASPFPEEAS
jgi:cytochrome c-type biogenesis protein CcmH/NrfG